MYATYAIYIIYNQLYESKHLDLSVDYTKVVVQLCKPLKIQNTGYGILGLMSGIQIDDAFNGNILL